MKNPFISVHSVTSVPGYRVDSISDKSLEFISSIDSGSLIVTLFSVPENDDQDVCSSTARQAASKAASISAIASESVLAMEIRPNCARPISTIMYGY